MAAFGRFFAWGIVCLTTFSVAQIADQAAAARVLGPRWRQMSRVSGMIFSGTVLGIEAQTAREGRPLPVVLTRFQVDRAIVGVRNGEVVTIREWSGAWSMHRAMRGGERMLIFLYPPSRLGLTSPVDGSAGQVALDSRGAIVRTSATEAGVDSASAARLKSCPPEDLRADRPAAHLPDVNFSRFGVYPEARFAQQNSPFLAQCSPLTQYTVTLRQLERAILNARRNSSAPPLRIPARIKE